MRINFSAQIGGSEPAGVGRINVSPQDPDFVTLPRELVEVVGREPADDRMSSILVIPLLSEERPVKNALAIDFVFRNIHDAYPGLARVGSHVLVVVDIADEEVSF